MMSEICLRIIGGARVREPGGQRKLKWPWVVLVVTRWWPSLLFLQMFDFFHNKKSAVLWLHLISLVPPVLIRVFLCLHKSDSGLIIFILTCYLGSSNTWRLDYLSLWNWLYQGLGPFWIRKQAHSRCQGRNGKEDSPGSRGHTGVPPCTNPAPCFGVSSQQQHPQEIRASRRGEWDPDSTAFVGSQPPKGMVPIPTPLHFAPGTVFSRRHQSRGAASCPTPSFWEHFLLLCCCLVIKSCGLFLWPHGL